MTPSRPLPRRGRANRIDIDNSAPDPNRLADADEFSHRSVKSKPRIPVLNASDRLVGKVKRLEIDRGFGFLVTADDPRVDYFFHFSVLTGGADAFQDLDVGDDVEFYAIGSDKGPRVVRATKVDSPVT